MTPDSIHGHEVRIQGVEREVEKLRSRSHEAIGQIAALRTLAEVGAEQRTELIREVASLRAETAAGFGRRDSFMRWVVGLAILGGPTVAAAIAALLR